MTVSHYSDCIYTEKNLYAVFTLQIIFPLLLDFLEMFLKIGNRAKRIIERMLFGTVFEMFALFFPAYIFSINFAMVAWGSNSGLDRARKTLKTVLESSFKNKEGILLDLRSNSFIFMAKFAVEICA